jgi:hypothetical protein
MPLAFKFKLIIITVIILFYRELVFEKAYCQYRLNLPQEAVKTLNTAVSLSLKLKELKAQILYRLERYSVTGTVEGTFLVTDCKFSVVCAILLKLIIMITFQV